MPAASWFKYSYLAYVSQPRAQRKLYRLVKRRRVARIVEVGIRDVSQSISLVEVAQRFVGSSREVAYTALDWFDARPAGQTPLSIKGAYAELSATGAQVRLVPGAPATSLPAIANAHANTDLLLIADFVTDGDLGGAWFYVPRMLDPNSLVYRGGRDTDGAPTLARLTSEELAARADGTHAPAHRSPPRRAA